MTDHARDVAVWRPPPDALSRAVFGALPLLAALGPVLTLIGGLFAFRIVCALLIAYAAVFLLGRRAWTVADALLLLTTVAFLVSGGAGLSRVTADSDNPYSELLAVLLGLSTALASRAWQRRVPGIHLALARGWVAAALLMAALAVVEVVTGIHWPGYLESAQPDPAVTFGNPNALAVFVVMANVWAIPVRRAPGLEWRAMAWALLPATAVVLLLTNARIALIVWLLVLGWSTWRAVRRSRDPMAGVGEALVPLAAALGFLVLGQRLISAVTEIATTGSSGGVRDLLARHGLEIARHNGGLPTWPGSFEHHMIVADDPRLGYLINAHNMWIEILVQYGAIALLLLLAWLGACVVAGRGARDEIAVGVVALLLLAIVDSSFLDDAPMWMFVLSLAVASRVGVPSHEPRLPQAGPKSTSSAGTG
jgi:hypothetical protein